MLPLDAFVPDAPHGSDAGSASFSLLQPSEATTASSSSSSSNTSQSFLSWAGAVPGAAISAFASTGPTPSSSGAGTPPVTHFEPAPAAAKPAQGGGHHHYHLGLPATTSSPSSGPTVAPEEPPHMEYRARGHTRSQSGQDARKRQKQASHRRSRSTTPQSADALESHELADARSNPPCYGAHLAANRQHTPPMKRHLCGTCRAASSVRVVASRCVFLNGDAARALDDRIKVTKPYRHFYSFSARFGPVEVVSGLRQFIFDEEKASANGATPSAHGAHIGSSPAELRPARVFLFHEARAAQRIGAWIQGELDRRGANGCVTVAPGSFRFCSCHKAWEPLALFRGDERTCLNKAPKQKTRSSSNRTTAAGARKQLRTRDAVKTLNAPRVSSGGSTGVEGGDSPLMSSSSSSPLRCIDEASASPKRFHDDESSGGSGDEENQMHSSRRSHRAQSKLTGTKRSASSHTSSFRSGTRSGKKPRTRALEGGTKTKARRQCETVGVLISIGVFMAYVVTMMVTRWHELNLVLWGLGLLGSIVTIMYMSGHLTFEGVLVSSFLFVRRHIRLFKVVIGMVWVFMFFTVVLSKYGRSIMVKTQQTLQRQRVRWRKRKSKHANFDDDEDYWVAGEVPEWDAPVPDAIKAREGTPLPSLETPESEGSRHLWSRLRRRRKEAGAARDASSP